MALGITEPVAEVNDTTNTNSYAFGAFTPTANSYLVVIGSLSGLVGGPPTMSGGSLTWTLQQSQTGGGQYLFLFTAPTGASPASCTATIAGITSATGCTMGIFQVTGTNLTLVQSTTNTGTSATPTVTFSAALNTNNAYCSGAEINGRNSNEFTPPTSWTEIFDASHGTPADAVTGNYRVNGESSTTVTYGSMATGSGTWGVVGIEFSEGTTFVAQVIII